MFQWCYRAQSWPRLDFYCTDGLRKPTSIGFLSTLACSSQPLACRSLECRRKRTSSTLILSMRVRRLLLRNSCGVLWLSLFRCSRRRCIMLWGMAGEIACWRWSRYCSVFLRRCCCGGGGHSWGWERGGAIEELSCHVHRRGIFGGEEFSDPRWPNHV